MQDKVHGQADVAAILLDEQLPVLLSRPEGFELVIRSLPGDSARQKSLYERMLTLPAGQGKQAIIASRRLQTGLHDQGVQPGSYSQQEAGTWSNAYL